MNEAIVMPWDTESVLEAAENPPVLKEVREKLGFVPYLFHHVSSPPWVAKALTDLYVYRLQYMMHLPRSFKDTINLVLAHETSCRYCYGMARTMMKLSGYSDEKIRQLEQNMHSMEKNGWEKQALVFVRMLSRMNPRVAAHELQALEEAGMSREAVKELVYFGCIVLFFKRFTMPLAIQPDGMENIVHSPVYKLARPLLKYFMDRTMYKRRTALNEMENQGPFADILATLDEIPTARNILRSMMNQAWDSNILPRRTKALIFAVIGRTLNCRFTVEEAARLLEIEGISREQLDTILTYLHSDELDSLDERIINFARETVRMQQEHVQKQCRDLSEVLSREMLLEVLGIAALANTTSRLSVLMERA